ncbi:MAG: hypothetical protein HOK41_02150 [Nitrospina sp.]|jgi:hypothetical protein|nr:hypothetical protein [Nitrospina sp.]
MKSKTFLIRLFILIFLGYVTVHVLTVSIDPYQIRGFNPVNKYAGGLIDRFSKPLSLEKNGGDFKIFIIGSSRVRNFNPLMVEKISKKKTFNYSLVNGSLEDYIAVVNHIVHVESPEIIYLQLDFYTFNENHSTRNNILNTPLEKYLNTYVDLKKGTNGNDVSLFFDTTYFSLVAFLDAYKCVKLYLANHKKEETHPNVPDLPPAATLDKDEPSTSQDQENKKVGVLKHYFYTPNDKSYPYYNYRINELMVTRSLGFIKQMVEENQVKLIISLSPMNKEHLGILLSDENLTKNWFRVKEILANIFPSYHDFNNCSVNAFRGPLHWVDSVHMTVKLAKIMMSVVLSQPISDEPPEKFGFQVTPERLSDYLLHLNESCE